jgi:hypothetical protein
MARVTERPQAAVGRGPGPFRRLVEWLAGIASLLGAMGGALLVGGVPSTCGSPTSAPSPWGSFWGGWPSSSWGLRPPSPP